MLVEAQLAWYGFDYEHVRIGDVFMSADSRAKAAAVNPLGQIPTLIFDEGRLLGHSKRRTLVYSVSNLLYGKPRVEAPVPVPSENTESLWGFRCLVPLVTRVFRYAMRVTPADYRQPE